MRKENLKTEQGRSMVEMLGVLAVIGVLTIIGITAFRYALNRHYANDLLHEVHRVAYSYSGHLLTAGNGAAFDVNSVEPAAADASFSLKPYDDYFMVGVEGVEKAVCEQAAGTELPVSFQRRVYCDEGAMEFYFANDMGACDDAEKCALPEVCTEGQNQCGRLCCEQGETCMPGRCCPSGKYIVATNTCCEGDEVAYDITGQGNYVCKEPEEGDSCMGANGPDQSKCNLSGDEKLYCKVTEFSGCNPYRASCQEVPGYTPKPLTFANGTTPMGDSTWIVPNVDMDWWSASDFCDSLGKELSTYAGLCHNVKDCSTQPSGHRVNVDTGKNGTWLDSADNCNANFWSVTWGVRTYEKYNNAPFVCQPKGYTEPNPICPNGGTYNLSTNTCGKICSTHANCGDNEYCKIDTNTVGSNCSASPTGLCTAYPSYNPRTLTFANGTTPMGDSTWIVPNVDMDWWSASDFCDSLGKELSTYAGLCHNVKDCSTQPSGHRVNVDTGKNGTWLDSADNCNANFWSVTWGVRTYEKYNNAPFVCQPKGYTEPDPICQTGTYDISSNTCQ